MITKKITKKDTSNFVRNQISRSDIWAKKALLKIYANQTDDEQNRGETVEDNGIGFTGADAEILSSFSRQLTTKGWLSPKQMSIVMKKMPKYHRQIIQLSDPIKLKRLVSRNLN